MSTHRAFELAELLNNAFAMGGASSGPREFLLQGWPDAPVGLEHFALTLQRGADAETRRLVLNTESLVALSLAAVRCRTAANCFLGASRLRSHADPTAKDPDFCATPA